MLITINRRAVYLHNPDPSITVGRLSAPACLHSGCLHYVITSAAKQSVCEGNILGHGGRYVYEDCFVARVRSSQRHSDHLSLRAQRSNLSATAAFWAMADVTFTKIASSQSALLATTLRSLVIASAAKQSVRDGSILGHGGRYVYEDCFVAKCAPRKDIAITCHCEPWEGDPHRKGEDGSTWVAAWIRFANLFISLTVLYHWPKPVDKGLQIC